MPDFPGDAVDFRTWRSLAAGKHVGRVEVVECITAVVEAATAPQPRAAD